MLQEYLLLVQAEMDILPGWNLNESGRLVLEAHRDAMAQGLTLSDIYQGITPEAEQARRVISAVAPGWFEAEDRRELQ